MPVSSLRFIGKYDSGPGSRKTLRKANIQKLKNGFVRNDQSTSRFHETYLLKLNRPTLWK